MAQNAVITSSTADVQFPSGTQAAGKWRFTEQVGAGPVTTQLEDAPSTVFEDLAAGSHTVTAARMGVDTVTVLGAVFSVVIETGAQVTLTVAAGITWSVVTVP